MQYVTTSYTSVSVQSYFFFFSIIIVDIDINLFDRYAYRLACAQAAGIDVSLVVIQEVVVVSGVRMWCF